tara:strand:- start:197057 stop:200419 length:3363 start_codon:yes stop_codon:yes gene_type:complete
MVRFIALLMCMAAAVALGQETAVPPNPASLPLVTMAKLDAATEQATNNLSADDPQRETLQKLYAETRAALEAVSAQHEQIAQFSAARAGAVAQARAIQAQLAQQRAAGPVAALDANSPAVPSDASLAELEQTIQLRNSALAALKGQAADKAARLDAMPERAAQIRARLIELADLQSVLDTQLALMPGVVEPGSEAEARLWLARATAAQYAAEKESLDEELLSQPMRQELVKAELDKANYRIAVLGRELAALKSRAGELRQDEAQQALAQAEQVRAGAVGKHPLVQALAQQNAEMSASFAQRGDAIEAVRQRESDARGQAEQLETDLKAIERKLEILGMTATVGKILREQASQLPPKRAMQTRAETLNSSIGESSLRQIELGEERRRLGDIERYVNQLVARQPGTVSPEVRDDLLTLAQNRHDLVRQAINLENTYALALGDLDFSLHRYNTAVENYRSFVSARLLWMPSRAPMELFTEFTLWQQLREVLTPSRWLALAAALPAQIVAQPLTLLLALVVALLLFFNQRLRTMLKDTAEHVSDVRRDTFGSTVFALGLTLLLALKWPSLVLLFAWLMESLEPQYPLSTALYVALGTTALYFFGLEFQRILLLPQGLVARHFRWPPRLTHQQYKRLLRLEQTFLPASFFVAFSMSLYPRIVGGSLGALAVIGVLLSIAHFFNKMPVFVQGRMDIMFIDTQPEKSALWGKVLRRALIWMPLATIVAVLLGYTYAAIEFSLLLVETVVLYMLLLLAHELGLRWLRLTRRRMMLRVREDMAQAANEEGEITLEDDIENDPALLSDEGTKLLNTVLVIIGVLGVVVIWSEVFPALSILDSVQLWHQTGLIEGSEALVPVTLADLFSALIIAVLGWVVLRRLPSLLEILLRRRMHVSAASAYAATRVFQYSATLFLLFFVLGALGAKWSQFQWAVAALSVGIGFGLQEIVANFISGLIILFEQPIRVGDTVTVGEVSGKVTRIRIRATTIRDWDGRELLVPNKEFVTNQLLNWSLSDPVTRSVLEVGVAYGTDMDKAMSLVRQACEEHARVLREPPPQVTFDAFGDNSLLITVRFFLEELDKRLLISSELRLEINRRFAAEGISVAFPQRDVHLDTSRPLEVTLHKAAD